MKRVFAHIGFSMALTLVVLNLIDIAYIPVIIMGLVVILTTSLILKKYRQALTVPVCVASAIFACIVFLGVYNADAKPQLELNEKEAVASFYIVELPECNGDSYTYTVKTEAIELNNSPQNIKLRITTDEKLNVDNYQVIEGTLQFKAISDNAFNSYGYWADNVFLTCSLQDYSITQQHIFSLNKYVLDVRQNIIDVLSFHLLGDNGALAIALVTGDMSFLTDKAYNDFKLSGTTHIMAVSGMHLVVIMSVLYFVMNKLHFNTTLRISTTLVTIIFYIALAGFAKSIIRAGIMTGVVLLGELFKRRSDALNSLGIAVALMCFNPFVICDIGAVLSVLAVLAIVTIYSSLDNKIFKIEYFNKPIIKSAISNALVTLSVMLYSVPILYIYFGYVSIVSVIANVILVPIGSFALIISILAYLFSLFGSVGVPFVFVTKISTQIMLDLSAYFASSRYAIMSFCDYFYIILAACFAIAGVAFLTKNKKNVKIATVSVVSVLVVTMLVSSFTQLSSKDKILICGDNAVIITCDDATVVAGVSTYDEYYSVKNYLFKHELDADVIVLTDNLPECSIQIARDFDCKTFIMPTGKDYVLYDLPDIDVVQTDYQQFKVNDAFAFTYSSNALTVTYNGFDISVGDSIGDIVIDNGFVKDCNGDIDLSQGNVVYYLSENKEFTVRRVN